MRTTLSIDDDVLLAVQERARRERRTAGRVLSELARLTLTSSASSDAVSSDAVSSDAVSSDAVSSHAAPEPGRHAFHPLPHRGAAVTNELIDRLREGVCGS